MIGFRDKHIEIDGRKTFLYGAECHYFRLDPCEWRDRLQKIRDAGFNLVSTYVPWMWHEPEEGVFDFTGSTHPRRNLEGFLALCQSFGFYCIVRPGPYVMSELKNEGIPGWLLERYPEIIARTKYGALHPTKVVSYLHPTFLSKVSRWYEAVCQWIRPALQTHGGSVIMFQLDNEIGMLHWVSNQSDYNEDTMRRYHRFVTSRQHSATTADGDTANACQTNNAAREDDSNQLLSIETGIRGHWLQGAFWRTYRAEYVRELKRIAEANGIDVPFIVNVHGFKDISVYSRGVDYPIGLSQLKDVGRIERVLLAGDFYPGRISYDNFHDLVLCSALTCAVSSPQQPLFSAEFQCGRLSDRPRIAPEDVDLIARLCIANGMNALNYYMFCGGDNPKGIGLFGRRHEWQAPIAADGQYRVAYDKTAHLGDILKVFGGDLCRAPLQIDTSIGFYSPYYMTETVDRADKRTSAIIADIETQREQFHFDGLWRLLVAANITFDAVDVCERDLDVSKMPTLWMASTQYMDAGTQLKLVRYVENGGRLVIGPRLPDKDLNGSPCRLLADALGIGTWEEKTGFQRVTVLETDSVFCRQYLQFEPIRGAEIVACGEAGLGDMAAFLLQRGSGQVLVLGVALTHEYQYALRVIHDLAAKIGLHPRLTCSDLNVVATERRSERGSLIFLSNVDDCDRTTCLNRIQGDAFAGHSVWLPARSGKVLPYNFHIHPSITIEMSTCEIVFCASHKDYLGLTFHIPGRGNEFVMFTIAGGYKLKTVGAAEVNVESNGSQFSVTIPGMVEPRSVTFAFKRE